MKMAPLAYGMLAVYLTSAVATVAAQGAYQVVSVTNGGSIAGVVKWSGPPPQELELPVTKDAEICDPESHKNASLERLIVAPEGGVANTVVFLKNISSGKGMDALDGKYSLDQKHCRYEPHILLVPQATTLQMKSSDPVLHIVHMDGAASYNIAFPFADRVITRSMNTAGVVNLKCNAGHLWMNAQIMVVHHPYYTVTDQDGHFELTNVPAGDYQIVAWHEGWRVTSREAALDASTHQKIERPIFSEAKTWEQMVTVRAGQTTPVTFVLSEK